MNKNRMVNNAGTAGTGLARKVYEMSEETWDSPM